MNTGAGLEERREQREVLRSLYADYDPKRHDVYVCRYNQDADARAMADYLRRRNIKCHAAPAAEGMTMDRTDGRGLNVYDLDVGEQRALTAAIDLCGSETVLRHAASMQPHDAPRFDVRASCYALDGNGSDGAYDLIADGATAEEICANLLKALKAGHGLTNAGPCRLAINIGPAGSGDVLPL